MNGRKLKSIVNAYQKLREEHPDSLLNDCYGAVNLSSAIEMAATARGKDGKRHRHQARLNEGRLQEFARNIKSWSPELEKAQSFDQIYRWVEKSAIMGIGELAIYDTAHRIGAFLKIYPNRIFLHRGTRTGAENLLGKIAAPYLVMHHLPAELQGSGLSPAEIEDLFCIFKDRLKNCQ